MIAEGASDELKNRVGGERLEVRLEDAGRAEHAIAALGGDHRERPVLEDGVVRVPMRDRTGAIARQSAGSTTPGSAIDDIAVRQPDARRRLPRADRPRRRGTLTEDEGG